MLAHSIIFGHPKKMTEKLLTRPFVFELQKRIAEKRPLIQVVLGPRQVGKTTGVQQLIAQQRTPTHYVSADTMIAAPQSWILEVWQQAKEKGPGTLLVIDEIQKIHNWSETIKKLWDAEPASGAIKPIVLGSSTIQLQRGLTESLTGRFETLHVFHWSFNEFREAFNTNLEEYLIYGGYPASYRYREDEQRWLSYMRQSIVETVITQDILSVRSVSNPSLFRQAFELVNSYPAQEISYTKLLGQLQDKGNTDLIKRYLQFFQDAFLCQTLSKYSAKKHLIKSSSPKILPLAPSLCAVQRGHTEKMNTDERGRIFEMIVGADLIRDQIETYYWRDHNHEVDFVAALGSQVIAIEVKSGRKKKNSGMTQFLEQFPKAKACFLSPENYEKFCSSPRTFLKAI
jgi:predicted AAA+ superfamily ATPase